VGRPAKSLEALVRAGTFRARRHQELLNGDELTWPAFAALQQKYRECGSAEERTTVALQFERAVRSAQRKVAEGAFQRSLEKPQTPEPRAREARAAVARLALAPNEAAEALGVSRDFFDQHIAPELRIVRRGRRRLVPIRELKRWLSEHASLPLADAR
jgi:excisionase family DNA binding protein